MALRDLFKKKPDDAPAGDAPVLAETTHLRAVDAGSHALATVLVEKYTERECQVLEQELLGVAGKRDHRLVVDLHKVMMLASAGIGSLVTIHKACAAGGGRLVLCGIEPNILAMLKLTRMDSLLTIVDTPEKAASRVS
jgi:anti-anti-sigma factor